MVLRQSKSWRYCSGSAWDEGLLMLLASLLDIKCRKVVGHVFWLCKWCLSTLHRCIRCCTTREVRFSCLAVPCRQVCMGLWELARVAGCSLPSKAGSDSQRIHSWWDFIPWCVGGMTTERDAALPSWLQLGVTAPLAPAVPSLPMKLCLPYCHAK